MGTQRFLMDGLRGLPGFDGLPLDPGPRPPGFGPPPGLPDGHFPGPEPVPFRPLPAGGFPPAFAPPRAGLPPGPGRAPLAPAGFFRGLLPAGSVASDEESRMASNSTANSLSVRSRQAPTGNPCRLTFMMRTRSSLVTS